MNVVWKVEKAERADAAADDDDQHCSLSAVQRRPVRNSHDGLNLRCLDQCHVVRVFVPMAQAPPKAGAKKVL